jgi:hypothetical protein
LAPFSQNSNELVCCGSGRAQPEQSNPSEDSDIDLFIDHRRGELGLFRVIDVKDAAAASSVARPTS